MKNMNVQSTSFVQSTALLALFYLTIFSTTHAQGLGDSLTALNGKLTGLKTSLEKLKTNLGKLSNDLQGKKSGESGIKTAENLNTYVQKNVTSAADMAKLLNESDESVKKTLAGKGVGEKHLIDVLNEYFKKSRPTPEEVATILKNLSTSYQDELTKPDNETYSSLSKILLHHAKNSDLENLHKLFNNLEQKYIDYLNERSEDDLDSDPPRIVKLLEQEYVQNAKPDNVMTNLYNFLKEINKKNKYASLNEFDNLFKITNRALTQSSSVQDKIKFFNDLAANQLNFTKELIINTFSIAIQRTTSNVQNTIKLLNGTSPEFIRYIEGKIHPNSFEYTNKPEDTITILNDIENIWGNELRKERTLYFKNSQDQKTSQDTSLIKVILEKLITRNTAKTQDIQNLNEKYGTQLKQEITEILEKKLEQEKQKKQQEQEEQRKEEEKEKKSKEYWIKYPKIEERWKTIKDQLNQITDYTQYTQEYNNAKTKINEEIRELNEQYKDYLYFPGPELF